jgi:type II secretory pathway pseudopilin PulG
MDKFIKNKRGFSFVEVISVLGIITIMTVVGLVSIQSRRVGTEVEASALEVTAAIREAQNNALTGKNASSESGSECNVYNFIYGSDIYRVGGPIGSEVNECPRFEYILKNKVVFTNSGVISFSIPSGTATLSGSSPQQIELRKVNDSYYICVTQSGSINAQKDPC